MNGGHQAAYTSAQATAYNFMAPAAMMHCRKVQQRPLSPPHTHTPPPQVARAGGDGSDVFASKGQWIKARQRSAFPPNYIHSVDSTHMMMTALDCAKEGEQQRCWVCFPPSSRVLCA
jgi:hypothetical protein